MVWVGVLLYRLEVSLKSQVAWNITLGLSLLYKVVFVFCGGKEVGLYTNI